MIPADSRVEIDAKIHAGYFTTGKIMTMDELSNVQGRAWEDVDVSAYSNCLQADSDRSSPALIVQEGVFCFSFLFFPLLLYSWSIVSSSHDDEHPSITPAYVYVILTFW
jgi:hypothetical protein